MTKLKVRKYSFRNVNKMRKRNKKLPSKFWIEGLPYEECGCTRCGPYDNREDAESDRDGMQCIFDDENYTGHEDDE
jgi:hypothetical protein